VEPVLERRLGRSTVLFLTVLIIALASFVPVMTSEVVPVFGSLVITGMAVMLWNIITVSLRQRITPDRLLGRVNAGYRFFAWGAMPIGALLGGLVAELFGIVSVFLMAGFMGLAMLGFRFVLSDEALDAAELPDAGAGSATAGSATAGSATTG
jgi:predicted MFS family arabinose efflux permease